MLEVAVKVVVVGIAAWGMIYTLKEKPIRIARQTYPEVEYEEVPGESTVPEKLRQPEAGLDLTVQHIAEGTSVSIPSITRDFEIIFQLFGWFMTCIGILGIVMVLLGFDPYMMPVAIPLAFLMGWTFLQVGRRVARIEFRRDNVILVVRFGGLFLRKFSFPWHPEIEFKGEYQSVLTMTSEQKEPDYKITITRPRIWFLPWSKSFLLACNQIQGSWIVGALKSWADRKDNDEM